MSVSVAVSVCVVWGGQGYGCGWQTLLRAAVATLLWQSPQARRRLPGLRQRATWATNSALPSRLRGGGKQREASRARAARREEASRSHRQLSAHRTRSGLVPAASCPELAGSAPYRLPHCLSYRPPAGLLLAAAHPGFPLPAGCCYRPTPEVVHRKGGKGQVEALVGAGPHILLHVLLHGGRAGQGEAGSRAGSVCVRVCVCVCVWWVGAGRQTARRAGGRACGRQRSSLACAARRGAGPHPRPGSARGAASHLNQLHRAVGLEDGRQVRGCRLERRRRHVHACVAAQGQGAPGHARAALPQAARDLHRVAAAEVEHGQRGGGAGGGGGCLAQQQLPQGGVEGSMLQKVDLQELVVGGPGLQSQESHKGEAGQTQESRKGEAGGRAGRRSRWHGRHAGGWLKQAAGRLAGRTKPGRLLRSCGGCHAAPSHLLEQRHRRLALRVEQPAARRRAQVRSGGGGDRHGAVLPLPGAAQLVGSGSRRSRSSREAHKRGCMRARVVGVSGGAVGALKTGTSSDGNKPCALSWAAIPSP